MRDMLAQSNPLASTPRARLLSSIGLAGQRFRAWIDATAARAAQAVLYQELSRLSEAELERRGIPRGELHRCVSEISDGPAGRR
jgi:hypothetical protein